MSERLERVKRFEELREGMIVVVKRCLVCRRGRCRAMLTERRERFGCDSFATIPSCGPRETAVRAACVESGRLFRVLDGLEEPSTETAAASGTTRRTPQKERA